MKHADDLLTHAQKIESSLKKLNHKILEDFINYLLELSNIGGSIFVAGNGGSAATANHFVTDLSKRNETSKLIPDSLCTNNSLITMVANDYGYDEIFLKQLQIKANSNSILLVLSASGNSENLIKCVNWAKQNGIKTAALIGFDGGTLKVLVDYVLHVPSRIGEFALIEDCHSIICHYIATCLKNSI
jgi:D-sedoheptulose 7-phosphate isomerase